MKNRIHIAVWVCALCCTVVRAEETWRFINLADWHWAEGYVWQEKKPDQYQETLKKHTAEVATVKKLFGGEVMILPGDSNGGHWDRPDFIKNFMPGSTPEEAVLKAGKLCYSGMIKAFKDGGYPILLMAVGDHEMGDNPWPANSAVARCQPQYKEAFSKAWNTNPDGGEFLYSKPVGQAASRPLGTPYEGTSYAYLYKNALFVTMDVFHQESPNKIIGEEGTVTGLVTGKYLEWLDQVLSEARKDSSIKHIFVQGHLPVLYPVRKVSSSGMLMAHGADSDFWKVLRKYKVDIYFAGEVHDNTVTKDPESDLMQVVTRGNFFNNVMTVDVQDDKVELTTYNHPGGDDVTDGKYETYGRLVIDKSGGKTVITGEGCLAVLDPAARILHFPCDQEYSLKDHPIVGLSARENKKSETQIRGQECDKIFPNEGAFGSQYSALEGGVELVEGVRGKAALLGENSRMAIWAMGPPKEEHAVSYAVWIKTSAEGNRLIINTTSIWNKKGSFLNLNLDNGAPQIMVDQNSSITAEGAKLNDGQWHHIAMSMPEDGCKLSRVVLYADGKRLKTSLKGKDLPINVDQAVKMSFGGLGYSQAAYNTLPVKPFVGALDEISLWARSLTDDEVKKLAEK